MSRLSRLFVLPPLRKEGVGGWSRAGWLVALGLLLTIPATAQTISLRTVPGPLANIVNELEGQGTSLYVGPRLTITRDGGASWRQPDYAPLVRGDRHVSSIDAQGNRVVAGLRYSDEDAEGDAVFSAGGYLTSHNAGQTWRFLPAVVDAVNDTLTRYGVVLLRTYPTTGPANAPPLDISIAPDSGVVYVAAGFAGLRRIPRDSTRFERVVLPPDELDEIRPDALNAFTVGPRQVVQPGNRVVGNYNHVVYSVLLDQKGVLWAGSYFGLNRSTDGGRSWRRYTATGSVGAPTGSFVTRIREQPSGDTTRSAVWFVTRRNVDRDPASARDGLLVTRDGGETFTQTLVGETIYDVAFRGQTVYAGGASGLFISDDGGLTWRNVRDFFDPNDPINSVPTERGVALSVAVTSDGTLWVGTGAGLAKSTDGGRTWRVFRTAAPLQSDEPGAVAVETYAYPNPFSPASVGNVRLRFSGDGQARI
ncbi:MAG TPA: hypothetical protein VD948_11705, partial [Rhodothermales bacterium]|nr:hypothetical protein [Rhodothermales bacterium]